MMLRDDISNQLIHFTKPAQNNSEQFLIDSLATFTKILDEKVLEGGIGYIKGKHKCVCFTEAPLTKLPIVFANRKAMEIPYSPYGFMFRKEWLFPQGARPVIYGPESDYELLPEPLKFRHVRFELETESYSVDHTWEREWRLLTEKLPLAPSEVTLVVPHRAVTEQIQEEYKSDNWHVIALSDLGVPVESIELDKI